MDGSPLEARAVRAPTPQLSQRAHGSVHWETARLCCVACSLRQAALTPPPLQSVAAILCSPQRDVRRPRFHRLAVHPAHRNGTALSCGSTQLAQTNGASTQEGRGQTALADGRRAVQEPQGGDPSERPAVSFVRPSLGGNVQASRRSGSSSCGWFFFFCLERPFLWIPPLC